jgi:hypothetical protein
VPLEIMKVSSKEVYSTYQCYLCAYIDEDYSYFTTMTVDYNKELVCVGCEDSYKEHQETIDTYEEVD